MTDESHEDGMLLQAAKAELRERYLSGEIEPEEYTRRVHRLMPAEEAVKATSAHNDRIWNGEVRMPFRCEAHGCWGLSERDPDADYEEGQPENRQGYMSTITDDVLHYLCREHYDQWNEVLERYDVTDLYAAMPDADDLLIEWGFLPLGRRQSVEHANDWRRIFGEPA